MRKLALTFLLTALIINISNNHSFAADPLRTITPTVPSSVIMQAFYWDCWPLNPAMSWYDVIIEQAPAMQAAGITHFWFPPPNKDKFGLGGMGYALFDPFDIGQYYQKGTTRTRFGYKYELQAAAAAVGGNVLLDLVPNHMLGGDSVWDPYDGTYRYQSFTFVHERPDWGPEHFYPCGIHPDPFEPLIGEEVNHSHPEVRARQKYWANWLRETVGDVTGFRIDGVKHFCWDMSDEFGKIGDSIGEYWCSRHNIREWMFSTGNFAFDFPLYWAMDGRAEDLHGAGLGMDKAVSFVGNHDTNSIDQKIRAYGFIMYIEPIPKVFWLNWFNPHIQPAIKRAMAAREAHNFSGTHTKHVETDLIIFGNDGGVYGVFNSGPDWAGAWVQLTPNATYYAIAWGGFDDAQPMPVFTDADGWVRLSAAGGGFAYYVIPEPATLILLGLGLSGLAVAGKKKKK